MLALGFISGWKTLFTGKKASLVVGGARTQVLADSIAIAVKRAKPLYQRDPAHLEP